MISVAASRFNKLISLNETEIKLSNDLINILHEDKNIEEITKEIYQRIEKENLSLPLLCNIIKNTRKITDFDWKKCEIITDLGRLLINNNYDSIVKMIRQCKEEQGLLAGYFLCNNLSKKFLDCWTELNLSLDERLFLCYEMISHRGDEKLKLLDFQKFGLNEASFGERMAICEAIAKKLIPQSYHLIYTKFKETGFLNDINICESEPELLYKLYKFLEFKWGPVTLVDNLKKLCLEKLSVENRLKIIQEIISKGDELTLNKLYFQFDYLFGLLENVGLQDKIIIINKVKMSAYKEDFLKDFDEKILKTVFNQIREYENDTDRLKLCAALCSGGEETSEVIIKHFKDFGWKNKSAQREAFYQFCLNVASIGPKVASALLENLDNFEVADWPLKEKLHLLKLLCKNLQYRYYSSSAFQKNIKKLNFIENLKILKYQDLQNLINELNDGEQLIAHVIANNIDDLNLNIKEVEFIKFTNLLIEKGLYDTTVDLSRNKNFLEMLNNIKEQFSNAYMDEYIKIISKSKPAAICLAKHAHRLGVNEVDVNKRLELCEKIIDQGKITAKILADHISTSKDSEEINLHGVDSHQLMKLYKKIATNGEKTANTLAGNLDKLNLTEKERFYLFNFYSKLYEKEMFMQLSAWEDNSKQKQVIYEVLTPPKDLFFTINPAKEIPNEIFEVINYRESPIDPKLINSFRSFINENPEIFSFIAPLIEKIRENEDPILHSNLIHWASYTAGVLMDLSENEKDRITDSGILTTILDHKSPTNRYKFVRLLNLYSKDLYAESGPIKKIMERIGTLKEEAFENTKEKYNEIAALNEKIAVIKNLGDQAERRRKELEIDKKQKSNLEIKTNIENIKKEYGYASKKATQESIEKLKKEVRTIEQEIKSIGSKLSEKLEIKDRQLLTSLLCMPLQHANTDEKSLEFFDKLSHAGFHDLKRFNSLIQYFLEVYTQAPYDEEDSALFLKAVADCFKDSTDIKIITKKFDDLNNVLTLFGKEVFIEMLKNNQDPKEYLLSKFRELFGVSQELLLNYDRTFEQFRDPGAIFTYLKCVNTLSKTAKEQVLKVLQDYVQTILEGSFQAARYSIEHSPHLKKVFSLNEHVKELWIFPQKAKELTDFSAEIEEIDYKKFFIHKIINDKHIDPGAVSRLVQFLENKPVQLSDSEETMEQLQNFAIKLCLGKMELDEFIKEARLLKGLPNEFLNDLKSLMPKKRAEKLLIVESDDPCDLLLMGTEVLGSCLRINGDSSFNKCLMSCVMNGELKMIAAKDSQNKITARRVMCLMIDPKNEMPVIFLERLYTNYNDPSIDKEIFAMAQEKAKKMGIPLLISAEEEAVKNKTLYEGEVKHLGGYAPFMYSDASGGVQTEEFSIKNCQVLYDPKIKKDK